tara:strand:+ start:5102 stop:5314 length:213 start_codon:yes stop_codon:yes gene_type:complete
MKVANAEVTYRGWENGPAWGTYKEMKITFDLGAAEVTVKNVDDYRLLRMIEQLEALRVQLAEAPMKNAWG